MQKQRSAWRGGVFALAVLGAAVAAPAAVVVVTNPSFEADVLTGAGTSVPFITGWTGTTAQGDPNAIGTFRPSIAMYPTGVPDGVNAAYIGDSGTGASIHQTLSASVQPLMKYTLTFSVGNRLDFGNSGYVAEVDAGGVQLAALFGVTAPVPPPGMFAPKR